MARCFKIGNDFYNCVQQNFGQEFSEGRMAENGYKQKFKENLYSFVY